MKILYLSVWILLRLSFTSCIYYFHIALWESTVSVGSILQDLDDLGIYHLVFYEYWEFRHYSVGLLLFTSCIEKQYGYSDAAQVMIMWATSELIPRETAHGKIVKGNNRVHVDWKQLEKNNYNLFVYVKYSLDMPIIIIRNY